MKFSARQQNILLSCRCLTGRWPGGASRSGYTLMEMITVILVVAAVASVAMPAADGFRSQQQVNAQASVLVGDIRYARSWAMSEQGFCRLVFSNDKASWVVQEHCVAGDPVLGEPTTTWAGEPATTYTANPIYWRSIIEEPAREVEGAIDVQLTPDVNPTAI
ncbi:MAG TPA: prepilin-type N-terminal cleavage/methylation domain-containing protein, partial [Candidatus Ozemobacteraceae bacterium]|nr:prepilin-type N-terminal cleavage/methylation domain-containing protein [Candidatus Ozemobacteraceae bacterium]